MSTIDNIDGIYAKDTELRTGINSLRSNIINQTIKPLTVTQNGATYTADPTQGTYGYSPITVNVPSDDTAWITRSLESITFPEGITEIGAYAFAGMEYLESIEIPNTVTSIDSHAFTETELTDIVIPDSVTYLGEGTFESCTSLTSITLPRVRTIGYQCFAKDFHLETVEIGSNINRIREDAFEDCDRLTTITINKAEGSITGAPWGAPNATVVWTG